MTEDDTLYKDQISFDQVCDDQDQSRIIIIGGTSGLGLALALHHLELGWQVSVVGHSQTKIAHINSTYPLMTTYSCDLTDFNERQHLLDQLSNTRFDRLIYSAGSYTNERVQHLNQADSTSMLAINLQAFEHILMWASEVLKRQKQIGDIKGVNPSLICIASIAGMLDYPYASLYAKSKRAMITVASAYRVALAPFNIQVNCIAPGYIDTQALRDLNDGDASHKPFIMSSQTAVSHIMQAIDDDVALAIFPRAMRHLTCALNHLPKPVLNWLLRNQLDRRS